jgi:hypothetical protein
VRPVGQDGTMRERAKRDGCDWEAWAEHAGGRAGRGGVGVSFLLVR